MKTNSYLKRFKLLLIRGIRISIVPTVLINAFIAILISMYFYEVEPSGDFTNQDAVYYTFIDFSIFTFVVMLGVIFISSVFALLPQVLSNIKAVIFGSMVGIVCASTANLVIVLNYSHPADHFRKYMFDLLFMQVIPIYSLLSITTIFILGFVSRSLNKSKILLPLIGINDGTKEESSIELQIAWYVTQVIFIGCIIVFAFRIIYGHMFENNIDAYYQPYGGIAVSIVGSGFILLITLPIALLAGLMLGSIVRTKQKSIKTQRVSILLGILTSAFAFIGVAVAKSILFGNKMLEPPFSGQFITDFILLVIVGGVIGRRLQKMPPNPAST